MLCSVLLEEDMVVLKVKALLLLPLSDIQMRYAVLSQDIVMIV